MKQIVKSKWVWLASGLFVFFIVLFASYNVGYGSGFEKKTVNLEGEAVTYKSLVSKIAEKTIELEQIETELTKNQDKLEEVKGLEEKKQGLNNAIKEHKESLADYEKRIEEVKTEVAKANELLSIITATIKEAKGKPIKLGAGYYYFGEDVPPGRYKLMPQEGERGNVFIRGLDGYSKVSDTFGKGEHAIESFIFSALDGEEIEATIPVLLQPME